MRAVPATASSRRATPPTATTRVRARRQRAPSASSSTRPRTGYGIRWGSRDPSRHPPAPHTSSPRGRLLRLVRRPKRRTGRTGCPRRRSRRLRSTLGRTERSRPPPGHPRRRLRHPGRPRSGQPRPSRRRFGGARSGGRRTGRGAARDAHRRGERPARPHRRDGPLPGGLAARRTLPRRATPRATRKRSPEGALSSRLTAPSPLSRRAG